MEDSKRHCFCCLSLCSAVEGMNAAAWCRNRQQLLMLERTQRWRGRCGLWCRGGGISFGHPSPFHRCCTAVARASVWCLVFGVVVCPGGSSRSTDPMLCSFPPGRFLSTAIGQNIVGRCNATYVMISRHEMEWCCLELR